MSHLRCPYCGGKLNIYCEYVGRPYLSENTPTYIECDDYCGAEWETNGDLKTPGRQS